MSIVLDGEIAEEKPFTVKRCGEKNGFSDTACKRLSGEREETKTLVKHIRAGGF